MTTNKQKSPICMFSVLYFCKPLLFPQQWLISLIEITSIIQYVLYSTTSLVLFYFLDAKEMFYEIFVRLATMCGSEHRALNKTEKIKMKVAETKNAKIVWLGVNRIRNEHVRGSLGVTNVENEREKMERWFGHVERRMTTR